MTIFILCNRLDEMGGVQRVVRTLADGFVDNGFDVQLVGVSECAHPHRLPSEHAVHEHTLYNNGALWRWLSGIRLGPIHFGGSRAERLRLFSRQRAVAKLRQLMTHHPGSVFIAMDVFCAELVATTLTKDAIGIFQFHNSFQSVWGTRDGKRITKLASALDRMVALTDADARSFEQATGAIFDHVNNPLPYGRTGLLEARQPVVITMGRFTTQKSLNILLEAWVRVSTAEPTWRLEIVGSGPEGADLRARVKGLGLAESVSILPPTNDVPTILSRASIFALSSRYEGLPMVLIEAMAFGLPIAATDCSPGVRQLVHDRCCGLLSPVGDVEALATNLIKLIRDAETRNAMSCMARTGVDEYRLDSVLEKWKSVIGEIREGKAGA